MKKKIAVLGVILGAVFVLSGCGKAGTENGNGSKTGNGKGGGVENQDQNRNRNGNQGDFQMPEGATAACEGKSEGDTCQFSFENRDGEEQEMSGTCGKNPQSEELACRPEMRNRQGNGQDAPSQ